MKLVGGFLIPSITTHLLTFIHLYTFGIWGDYPHTASLYFRLTQMLYTLYTKHGVEDVARLLSLKRSDFQGLVADGDCHFLGNTWQADSSTRTVSSASFLLVPNWLMSWPMHQRSSNPLPGHGTNPMN